MTLQLGTGAVNKIYLGDTEIKKAYLGDTLVYDKTGGAPPETGMLSSTIYVWDASNTTCYPGSGQTFAAVDKDGTPVTSGDLWLGATSSASTDDPTFSTDKFTTDGGDFFLSQGVPDSRVCDMGQTTQDFWVAIALRTGGSTNTSAVGLMSNATYPTVLKGFTVSMKDGTDTVSLETRGTTNASVNITGITEIAAGKDLLIIVSADADGTTNNIKVWVNGGEYTGSLTLSADADGDNITLCSIFQGVGAKFKNGWTLYAAAIGAEHIDTAKATRVKTFFEDITGKTFS